MSKRSRSRRPGGHPAKAARRRDRAGIAGAGGAGGLGLARQIVGEALELTSALDAELWGSSLLGVFWSRRDGARFDEDSDYRLELGRPLIEAVRRIGGPGARIALAVIEAVDDGELGLAAGELAHGQWGVDSKALPDWVAALGQAAVTDAAVMRIDVFDDARLLLIEARHPDGEAHAVAVLIDNNMGGMATDVLLADSIDRVHEVMGEHRQPESDLTLKRIPPGVAAGRIHAALELTDMTWDPLVSEDYAELQALALMRADEAPGYVVAEERPEVSSVQRDRLREQFLSSPEGQGFAADSEEAYDVSLAIDFCADYVDGRPLRWSPTVVELFMAEWIPHKVLGDAELFERLPVALDAWVRFAGRKSKLPDWAIAATCDAIPRWQETMVRRSNDPAAAGPAKQFLTAARNAGVDLEDGDALRTFVEDWHAGSGIT